MFPEIIRNTFTINIALMRIYSVSKEVIKKVRGNIQFALEKLHF